MDGLSSRELYDQAMKLLVWFEVLSVVTLIVVSIMAIAGTFDGEHFLNEAIALIFPDR